MRFAKWARVYKPLTCYCNGFSTCPYADAGYGSEENYGFMEDNDIEAYVKYNYFHAEQKKKFRENGFIAQNLFYNATDDYFVCPMGQHLQNKGRSTKSNQHGYMSEITIYEAANCNGCPLRCLCHKAKGNRRIEINHNLLRLKAKARELLLSDQGLKYRKKRCVEPEPVFSHIRSLIFVFGQPLFTIINTRSLTI